MSTAAAFAAYDASNPLRGFKFERREPARATGACCAATSSTAS
ncbi:MAG TPA: hypothetical protein VK601_14540 [Kofleriaceae bacterium]|nr:hypothetical protein [Kofleriaceae bacterium]